jgi:hypothetical protein
MRGITNDMVREGDYVKFRGHRVQRHLTVAWWKATSIEDNIIHLVDRHGATARMRTTPRYQHCHALRWEPGDDRSDES